MLLVLRTRLRIECGPTAIHSNCIMARILIVDTEQERLKVLRLGIKGLNHTEDCVRRIEEAQDALQSPSKRPDLLIVGEGFEKAALQKLLKMASSLEPRPAVVKLVSGGGSIEELLEAKEGADDCLVSPLNMATVKTTIERVLNLRPAQASAQIRIGSMLGAGQKMQQIFRLMLKAAAGDGPVVLQGEVGVGKQSAAKEIHRQGRRSAGGFGVIRCTNGDEQELESELFGYEKGAWPWAAESTDGLIKKLERGTLYIEGVEDSGRRLQVALVHFLEDRTYKRFRGHTPFRADVRIIASAREPLAHVLQRGSFLPELYYHLCANSIEIPPLRARPLDIPELVHFLLATQEIQIAGEAMDKLMNYQWPGNIDELESVLAGAAEWCENRRIEIEDLPAELVRAAEASGQQYVYTPAGAPQRAQQVG